MIKILTIRYLWAILYVFSAVAGAANGNQGSSHAEEEVRGADQALAAALAERDRDKFAALLTEDAVFFGGKRSHRGRRAVLEAWSVYFEPDGPTLAWEPSEVEVIESEGLATSTGPYRVVSNRAKKTRVLEGTYFTVWRRDADGQWRVLFDTGTEPEERRPEAVKADPRAGWDSGPE